MGKAKLSILRDVLSLVGVGCVSGALWRAELEWHGWAGLDWIGYIHLAVPVGAALFIVWAVWVNRRLPAGHCVFLALVLVLLTLVVYGITERSLALTENWRARMGSAPLERAQADVWWYLIPSVYAVVARILGLPVGFWRFLLAQWIFVAAAPTCIWLLAVVDHPGQPDFIHTIKSGFIIPFLVVAVGILYLPPGRREWNSRSSAGRTS